MLDRPINFTRKSHHEDPYIIASFLTVAFTCQQTYKEAGSIYYPKADERYRATERTVCSQFLPRVYPRHETSDLHHLLFSAGSTIVFSYQDVIYTE